MRDVVLQKIQNHIMNFFLEIKFLLCMIWIRNEEVASTFLLRRKYFCWFSLGLIWKMFIPNFRINCWVVALFFILQRCSTLCSLCLGKTPSLFSNLDAYYINYNSLLIFSYLKGITNFILMFFLLCLFIRFIFFRLLVLKFLTTIWISYLQ